MSYDPVRHHLGPYHPGDVETLGELIERREREQRRARRRLQFARLLHRSS